jgi:hypothetical protein
MKRIAIVTALAAVLIYGGDFAVLRSRARQFGSVHVRVLYAVKMKNRQTEYLPEDSQDESCVNSLFPQMGYTPCWYLSRHRTQTIDVDAGRRDMLLHMP